jgi:hypothetical protein
MVFASLDSSLAAADCAELLSLTDGVDLLSPEESAELLSLAGCAEQAVKRNAAVKTKTINTVNRFFFIFSSPLLPLILIRQE